MSYIEAATFHRAALLLGISDGETVIAWADLVLEVDPVPPAAIADVVLVPPGDLSAMRAALQPLAAATESPRVLRALLGVIARDVHTGRRSVKDTVTVLSQVRRGIFIPQQMHWALDTIEDDFMLANAGVTSELADCEGRVRAWLAPFTDEEPIGVSLA